MDYELPKGAQRFSLEHTGQLELVRNGRIKEFGPKPRNPYTVDEKCGRGLHTELLAKGNIAFDQFERPLIPRVEIGDFANLAYALFHHVRRHDRLVVVEPGFHLSALALL